MIHFIPQLGVGLQVPLQVLQSFVIHLPKALTALLLLLETGLQKLRPIISLRLGTEEDKGGGLEIGKI